MLLFYRAHLDYCSVVWSDCSKLLKDRVQRVLNYGLRLILSRAARTPCSVLRSELGWMTLELRCNMFKMCLVHRCVNRTAPVCLAESLNN